MYLEHTGLQIVNLNIQAYPVYPPVRYGMLIFTCAFIVQLHGAELSALGSAMSSLSSQHGIHVCSHSLLYTVLLIFCVNFCSINIT